MKAGEDILDEHISRSGRHALNIAIRAPRDVPAQVTDERSGLALRSFVDRLVRQSSRWCIVELDVHSSLLDSLYFCRRMRGRLPLLEEFYLKNQHFSSLVTAESDVAQTFLCAPMLRKADFRESRFLPSPVKHMPITHLGCTLHDLAEIHYLKSYPFITELHLDCWNWTETQQSPIVLSTIEKLGVRYSTILSALTLPALHTLTVRDHTAESCRILGEFIKRSACTLTVLSLLSGTLLDEVDLTDRAFRQVNRVTLPVPVRASETMRKLSNSAVLPSLKVLTVMVDKVQFADVESGTNSVTKEEFIAFLGQRQGLRLLRLYCSDLDFTALQDAGLRELENGGLKVTLDNFNSNHDEWKWWKGPYWFPHVTIP